MTCFAIFSDLCTYTSGHSLALLLEWGILYCISLFFAKLHHFPFLHINNALFIWRNKSLYILLQCFFQFMVLWNLETLACASKSRSLAQIKKRNAPPMIPGKNKVDFCPIENKHSPCLCWLLDSQHCTHDINVSFMPCTSALLLKLFLTVIKSLPWKSMYTTATAYLHQPM